MLANTFLHPTIATVAAASASIPILIHLLHRSRFRREPWAAMGFLLAANQRSARRIRMEQWLLLLVRMAIISGLGFAVARPFFPSVILGGLGRSRSHHVLLVDQSASMSIRDGAGGTTRLAQAIELCGLIAETVPPGDAISLISLSSPAYAVTGQPTYDRWFLQDRIVQLKVTQRGTDVAGGLQLASEIVGRVQSDFPPGNQFVYVISDMAKANWLPEGSDGSDVVVAAKQLGAAATLFVVDVSTGDSRNLAVTDLRITSAIAGTELPVSIEWVVSNFGPDTVRNVSTHLAVDDRIVRREMIDSVKAGATARVSARVSIPSGGGHLVSATVAADNDDAMPLDDTRFLAIDVDEAMPVLLLDADSAPHGRRGSSAYVATALSPLAEPDRRQSFMPRRIAYHAFAAEPLVDVGVVGLCGVPSLSEDDWSRLEGFVRAGGGLVVFAGAEVNASNYDAFGYSGGEGVLPFSLAASDSAVSEMGSTALAHGALGHAIVRQFSRLPDSSLFQTRVDRFSAPAALVEGTDVAMRFANGVPAIVLSSQGRGTVIGVMTSADMTWSNLPAKGDFVPLVVNMFAHAARGRSQSRTFTVGDAFRHTMPTVASASGPRITRPDGQAGSARLVVEDGQYAALVGPVERAGIYRLESGAFETSFAVNAAAMESDVRPVASDQLVNALGASGELVRAVDLEETIRERRRSSELGDRLLILVLALLFVESYLASRWGRYR